MNRRQRSRKIQKQFADMKLKSDVFVSKINDEGARIVEEYAER